MLAFREGAEPLDANAVHASSPVADLHAHPGLVAHWLGRDLSRSLRPPRFGYGPIFQQLDLPRMIEGGLRLLTACAYTPTVPPFPSPFQGAQRQLDFVEALCERAPGVAKVARKRGEVGPALSSAELATRRLLATHVGFRRFFATERNLSDDQARTVAHSGGVIGIISWSWLLKKRGLSADVEEMADAVVHGALVAGAEHVGIGTDFDGFVWSARRMREARHYPVLTEALSRRGFTREELRGILGGNYLRVLGESLPGAG